MRYKLFHNCNKTPNYHIKSTKFCTISSPMKSSSTKADFSNDINISFLHTTRFQGTQEGGCNWSAFHSADRANKLITRVKDHVTPLSGAIDKKQRSSYFLNWRGKYRKRAELVNYEQVRYIIRPAFCGYSGPPLTEATACR